MTRESELTPEEKARFAAWKSGDAKEPAPEHSGYDFEATYEKARRDLGVDAIDARSFTDLYDRTNIDADLQETERIKKDIEARQDEENLRMKKFATILEAIIHVQAELNEWFGKNANSIRPTEYDDIKNGVDEIIEIRPETESASHLALAIDVTFGSRIAEKLKEIKTEIMAGKLTRIKYFKSEETGYRGELNKVPKVVISVHMSTLNELADYWMNRKNKKLAEHGVQLQILEEIKMQLEIFDEFAEKQNKPELAAIYKRSLAIINRIIFEKELNPRLAYAKHDASFAQMEEALDKVF